MRRRERGRRLRASLGVYPQARRQGKQTAKRAYMAALKRGVPAERIEAGLRRYADYVTQAQVEDRYVMQAATFFRGARWTMSTAPQHRCSNHSGHREQIPR